MSRFFDGRVRYFYITFVVFHLSVLLFSENIKANQNETLSTPGQIKWFQPIIDFDKNQKKGTSVRYVLSGYTVPNHMVSISAKDIIVLEVLKKKEVNQNQRVLRKTIKKCRVYKSPNENAQSKKRVKPNYKLPVIDYDKDWVLVFRKRSGVYYLKKSCFTDQDSYNTFFLDEDEKKELLFKVQSDDEGYFELPVKTPPGMLQVPVEVNGPKMRNKKYLISLEVQSHLVVLLADAKMNPDFKDIPFYSFQKWHLDLNLSFGADFQSFSESVKDAEELNFSNVQFPSFGVQALFSYSQWGLYLSYRQSQNEIGDIAADLNVLDKEYKWQFMNADIEYNLNSWIKDYKLFDLNTQFYIILGAGVADSPHLYLDDSDLVSVYNVNTQVLRIGLKAFLSDQESYKDPKKWDFITKFLILSPLSSKIQSIKSEILNITYTETGSLGIELSFEGRYFFKDNFYGLTGFQSQLLNAKYKFEKTLPTVSKEGDRSIFDNYLNFGVGYVF